MVKKSSFTIKREIFRGKYYNTAREKGKIKARVKWSKDFHIDDAKRIYKSNRTFDIDLIRIKLKTKNYDEFVNISKTPNKPKKVRFAYQIQAKIKGTNKKFGASSKFEFWDSVDDAMQQAKERFLGNLAFQMGERYDEEIGAKFVNKAKILSEGVIYYNKKE